MQAEEKKLKVLKLEIEAGRHSDSTTNSAKVCCPLHCPSGATEYEYSPQWPISDYVLDGPVKIETEATRETYSCPCLVLKGQHQFPVYYCYVLLSSYH